VADRVSQVLRRIRLKARSRGLPVARLLPVAEAAVALLAGLLACWLCWAVFRGLFLSYRGQAEVGVSVPDDRAAEAAQLVAGLVMADDFQQRWASVMTEGDLRGAGELGAEAAGGAVVLSCRGSTEREVLGGLAAAGRLLREMSPPKLPPPDFGRNRAEAERQIGELAKQAGQLAEARRELELSPREQAAQAKLEAELGAARAEAERDARLLASRASEEVENRQALERMRAQLAKAGGARPLPEAELRSRRLERDRLEHLLHPEALQDSTELHPVVRRIMEVARELEQAELPEQIRRREQTAAEMAGLRRSAEASAAKHAALSKTREETLKSDAGRREKFDRVDAEWTRVRSQAAEAELTLKNLLTYQPLTVSLETDRRVGTRLRGAALYWVFLSGGLAMSAWLFLLLHRRLMPMLSVIDNEEDLAECLRTPVLGKLPRLAVLERR
jgi:hypothetical protein